MKAVNSIEKEGAQLLYESLQFNSTLTLLNTECKREGKKSLSKLFEIQWMLWK